MKITLLGTGNSTGVPQLLCNCSVCKSNNPKNIRTRFSILVETNYKTILVDTPFEIRLQLLKANIKSIDAIWITHAHSDHIAGIDDVRAVAFKKREPIPMFTLPETREILERRFDYLFHLNQYREEPFITAFSVVSSPIFFHGIEIIPLLHPHGHANVLSFRIKDFAFLADLSGIKNEEIQKITGVKVLVISTTVLKEHENHLNLEKVIKLIEKISPEKTYLTHMNHKFDYEEIKKRLPSHIEPAYDGLVIEV